ncbi:MAG TPA: NUDIX domain-containing protein [Candidatus Paceibacterota bacterium]|nr:NUDIX domain-containing protein [Candidatus Paceibacterota bacterium]
MAAEPKYRDLHRIAVTGIIWRKDDDGATRYLITKRAPHTTAWPGRWTVPGGGLEADDYVQTEASYADSESPQWYNAVEQALRREIREETGLEVSDISYLLDLAFIRPDGIPAIVLSFYCRYAGGEVSLDEDAVEHAWVTAEELLQYDLIPGLDHEIRQADERMRVAYA